MYRVRFFVNGIEIKPHVDYLDEESALKAGKLWEEIYTDGNFKQVYTFTIEKI